MKVGGIFKVLIVIVGCVLVGALVLNVIIPNVATTTVNAVEDQIYKATGLSFDINSDGHSGSNNSTYSGNKNDDSGTNDTGKDTVQGFN